MKRVAAYCRVSTDKEDQTNSFDAQQRYFRECIERNPDWHLQKIYADEGSSGTSTRKRTQFNAMIQAARAGRLDLIITKEVSRFARNTVDTLAYTRELRQRGIGVLFLSDNINSLDADGEFRLTIMASVAQEESRKTSIRVKWGQSRSMEQGIVFGSSLLGYHVANGRMSIDPAGAQTVKLIFYKYLNEQKGAGTIAKELQEAGILSSRGNLKWSAPTVLKILKNEKYCGDLVQKKTYTPDYLSHQKKANHDEESLIVLRDHHEPIIDRATWHTVQREIARRRRSDSPTSGYGNRYPLSGKIKCAHCGSSFVSRPKKTKSGRPYKVWRCGKATLEGKLHTDGQGSSLGCDIGRQLRDDVATNLLKHSVQAVQMDSERIVRNLSRIVESVLKDNQDVENCEKQQLERELEREQMKKQRILEEFLDRTISKADFQFMKQRCDDQIAQIIQQIEDIKKQQGKDANLTSSKKDIRETIKKIVAGDCATETFYGHLLHHMTVDSSGRVEVALNLLPARWIYVLDAPAEYRGQQTAQNLSSVPISVSKPFNSGVGIE